MDSLQVPGTLPTRKKKKKRAKSESSTTLLPLPSLEKTLTQESASSSSTKSIEKKKKRSKSSVSPNADGYTGRNYNSHHLLNHRRTLSNNGAEAQNAAMTSNKKLNEFLQSHLSSIGRRKPPPKIIHSNHEFPSERQNKKMQGSYNERCNLQHSETHRQEIVEEECYLVDYLPLELIEKILRLVCNLPTSVGAASLCSVGLDDKPGRLDH